MVNARGGRQSKAEVLPSRIDDFIRQEVTNQGHDVNDPNDGGIRVEWMREAWDFVRPIKNISVDIIEGLGQAVEREANKGGYRSNTGVNVRVGGRRCPEAQDVRLLMRFFVGHVLGNAPAIEAYRIFQLIHPFRDGNGRVGKIIYNWLLGKLDDPEMPPDLFGGGVA